MKRLLFLIPVAVALGCASMHSRQTNVVVSPNGATNTITTTLDVWTFFDAQSALAQYHATQEGTNGQSLRVGNLSQASQLNTNLLNVLNQALSAYLKTPVP